MFFHWFVFTSYIKMILFSFWLFGDKKCISLKEEEKKIITILGIKINAKKYVHGRFFWIKS